MSNLSRDVLYMLFELLQDDKNTLYSCLLVNRTWCEIIIPILWRNPWKFSKKKDRLSSVIISHLSNVSRNKIGNHNLLTNSYQKPSLNYIKYCKHLDLNEIHKMFCKESFIKILNEILSLFINKNMKFTHLYIHQKFGKINLIHGAESCFSRIEFLSFSSDINDTILSKLIETCKSIKKLELIIRANNHNYRVFKLIEAQKKLFNVCLVPLRNNDPFRNILENSLVKHANTIQYFKITERPTTNILSSFVNLKGLEIDSDYYFNSEWKCLKNLSLFSLQILKTSRVPINPLTDLIKNTNGFLFEIIIDDIYHNEVDNKRIIQAISQNCSNLKYLKLSVRSNNIVEFETLLINCQYLKGVYILLSDSYFKWGKLFKILTKSSSTSLFRFKFNLLPRIKSLKLFFDNWKGRHPMFLQFIKELEYMEEDLIGLVEKYKVEGVVKKFDIGCYYKDFEWI
ncbi:hypothetical protein RhiirA5_418991 [Rhizophagus irregularis]|uniref:F-box domain-containing protein n=1 Tax=Rhizophagus irregularis TaxID=588596 RepID=A0A2I1F4Y9_9GLOM|nr:hypothetical protein RhiirA5_418991 [Rhizophagus irregularis]PKC58149.1 hypothetical protein RhiirA1_471415 [Rhizophagus irregularis]PKY29427.1 hypothetical protein RhiirB3_446052 [Rhizophagus irregularis]